MEFTSILTVNGSCALTFPSGQRTEAGSNLTLNSMLSQSGAPGRFLTRSPMSTEKPVFCSDP